MLRLMSVIESSITSVEYSAQVVIKKVCLPNGAALSLLSLNGQEYKGTAVVH